MLRAITNQQINSVNISKFLFWFFMNSDDAYGCCGNKIKTHRLEQIKQFVLALKSAAHKIKWILSHPIVCSLSLFLIPFLLCTFFFFVIWEKKYSPINEDKGEAQNPKSTINTRTPSFSTCRPSPPWRRWRPRAATWLRLWVELFPEQRKALKSVFSSKS